MGLDVEKRLYVGGRGQVRTRLHILANPACCCDMRPRFNEDSRPSSAMRQSTCVRGEEVDTREVCVFLSLCVCVCVIDDTHQQTKDRPKRDTANNRVGTEALATSISIITTKYQQLLLPRPNQKPHSHTQNIRQR